MNDKIAEQIIKSMGSQMDLIFTLSVALCGGIVALIVQLAIHNRSVPASPLKLRGYWLLVLTFLFAGTSIIFGYLARGSITSSIPEIYRLDFSKIKSWGSASFEASCMLKFLFQSQFWTFFLAIICLFVVVILNRKLVKEVKHAKTS
jgi:hypothetical protein